MYCLVENSAVTDGPRELPHSWRNISNLPGLSDSELIALGWHPAVIVDAGLDPLRQFFDHWDYVIDPGVSVTCTAVYADRTAEEIFESTRLAAIEATQAEGLSRVQVYWPTVQALEELYPIIDLWPAINASQVTPRGILVKDIGVAGVAALQYLRNENRTQAEIDAYDPVTSPAWP